MAQTKILTQERFSDSNRAVSYDDLFERIKIVPKQYLNDISQYVNFVLYCDAKQKIHDAKIQTEKYCPKELADELSAENYMIGKPFPQDDDFDLEKAIAEDENDEPVPESWLKQMFPEL